MNAVLSLDFNGELVKLRLAEEGMSYACRANVD